MVLYCFRSACHHTTLAKTEHFSTSISLQPGRRLRSENISTSGMQGVDFMTDLDKRKLYRLPWSLYDNPVGWVEITDKCNMDCLGCYRNYLATDEGHKRLEDIKEEIIIEEIIDEETQEIIKACYEDAKQILLKEKDKLEKMAHILLEKEKIDEKDILDILGPRTQEKKAK